MSLLAHLPPSVARCVAPGAPEALRLGVAQGALPLPPSQLLCALAHLLADPVDAVRAAARETWTELPAASLAAALADSRIPDAVLHLVATSSQAGQDQVLRVLEHPAVGPRTLLRLGASDDPAVLSRIAGNQRVLDHYPEVARALLDNPRLDPGERGRLVSLYAPEEPSFPAPPPPPADDTAVPVAIPDALPPDLPRELLDDTAAPTAALSGNLYQQIQAMGVGEKLKLAMVGSKGARSLLIRDTNKVVSTAVIRSPKIREDEVLLIAQDRTVSEEIIRIILTRKDWLKNYPIRVALAQNPRTPLPRALRLLDTLQERDLRQIGKSRNVASFIATAAVRTLAKRGKH